MLQVDAGEAIIWEEASQKADFVHTLQRAALPTQEVRIPADSLMQGRSEAHL